MLIHLLMVPIVDICAAVDIRYHAIYLCCYLDFIIGTWLQTHVLLVDAQAMSYLRHIVVKSQI